MQDWYRLTDFEILSEMGQRIKAFRISKNLTQQSLADHSGLNRGTIRDLENGKPLNVLSLVQVFRSLEMLSRLNDLFPEITPVMAAQQAHRKRVKLSKKE
ncbi:MAG: helix-turn-helix domain-containing protein [Bacteroidales bacterium]|nr:helix-turn-helix domain-containing protein [Bacteroidales bacterium]